jgi:hypothetical protein
MKKFPKLRWIKPKRVNKVAALARVEDPLVSLLREVGIPAPDKPMSARDEAVFLLQIAAEVEHALLVQYLYALYSLDPMAGLPQSKWRGLLRGIAREEMGHLVTVQNLLLTLGAEVYLHRERTPPPQNLYPFPLTLEPFSLDSVKKYVVAESPLGAPLPDDLGDLKSGGVNHVGVLYAKLYWLFQPDDAPTGPWRLPPGISFETGRHLKDKDFVKPASLMNQLATPDEWNKGETNIYVLPATVPPDIPGLRAAAIDALYQVAAQGEGLNPQINSHYDRFLSMYQEMKAFPGKPARNLVTNPITRKKTGSTLLTNPNTLSWARLANMRYEILLTEIGHALSLSRDASGSGAAPRDQLISWAVGDNPNEMTDALRPVAIRLATLPATNTPGDGFAGIPFEFPGEDLPTQEKARWQRHLDLLDQAATLMQQLGNDPAIVVMRDTLDAGRRQFIIDQIAHSRAPKRKTMRRR